MAFYATARQLDRSLTHESRLVVRRIAAEAEARALRGPEHAETTRLAG